MILSKSQIQDILQGQFLIDCPKIKMLSCNPDLKNACHAGSGYIKLSNSNNIELRIYSSETFPLQEMFEHFNFRAGELIPEKSFSEIHAVDLSGTAWTTDKFIPEKIPGAEGSVVTGKVRQARYVKNSDIKSELNTLKITYSKKIDFPANCSISTAKSVAEEKRNLSINFCIAKFTSNLIDFEIEKNNDFTTIIAKSNIVFSNTITDTILNLFMVVTGSTKNWSIIEIRQNNEDEVRIQAIEDSGSKTADIPNSNTDLNAWNLFDKLLSYEINKETSSDSIPSLIRSIYLSQESSLEVQSLVLSASIETLLTKHFNNACIANDNIDSNIIAACEIFEKSKDLDDRFKKRLNGAILAMKNPRPKDYLSSLVNCALIDPILVKIYSKHRNKSVHGSSVKWGDFQEYINCNAAMLVLFYHLVFLRVEYTGTYIDYSTYEYPEKEFTKKLVHRLE